jgi:hypothetical protein
MESTTGLLLRKEHQGGILISAKPIVTMLSVAIFVFAMVSPSTANGSPSFMGRKFANCAALNEVYPGGVAKNSRVTNKGGATDNTPTVKPKVYKANSSKDRDKDGIACER